MDLIVCAFTGTGKSTAYADPSFLPDYERMSRTEVDQVPTQSKILYDSDSSNFPKDRFPENYLEYIQACRGRGTDVVQLVYAHDTVTAGLAALNILHIIVYPRAEDKELYLARYRERGNPEPFITLMDQKWDDFMVSVRKAAEHPMALGIELRPDQYVADAVLEYMTDLDSALKLINRNWASKFEPNRGTLKLDKPLMPDYPLGKANPYSHDAFRTVLVELVTKFRLTDKKIQRGTGISRVRLNKMYTSKKTPVAQSEWEALLAFAKTLNCYPFGPKRSTPVVTSPVAVTAIPDTESVGATMANRAKSTFAAGIARIVSKVAETEGNRSSDTNSIKLTGLAGDYRHCAEGELAHGPIHVHRVVDPATESTTTGTDGLDMIHPGAYDFKFSEDGTQMTYRVPTSDVRPEDIVGDLGQFFDKRDVQMATSEKHFEGDTFNTLPEGVNPQTSPELRTDPSDSSDRTVTFSGEVHTNEQTAPSAAEIAGTLGLIPPQAQDGPIRR